MKRLWVVARFGIGVGWVMGLSMSPVAAGNLFTDVSPSSGIFQTPATHDFWLASVASADFDGDGDLDLVVFGLNVEYNVSASDELRLLRNDGIDVDGRQILTEVAVPSGGLFGPDTHLSAADYDQDGDPDLLVASGGTTVLFRNDAGVLLQTDTQLPGYLEDSGFDSAYDLRAISWGDVDNDGDLDIIIPTVDTGGGLLQLEPRWLRNDGAGNGNAWTFTEQALHSGNVSNAQTRLADVDGDGDLDLWEVDVDNTLDTGFVRRFDNQNGQFSLARDLDISPLRGSADWADVDADGDLDVLVAGSFLDGNGNIVNGLRLYLDNGVSFDPVDLPVPAPNWLDVLACSWADYDGDGDVDLLVTGSFVGDEEIEGEARVYLNDGTGIFDVMPQALPAPVSSIGRGGAFLWVDIDGDADLDYLASGAFYVPNGNGLVEARTFLMRNPGGNGNQAPAMPQATVSILGQDGLQLSWTPPPDDSTPAAALTFELQLLPMSASSTQVASISQPGTLGQVLQWQFNGLSPGQYRWRLQALDRAHAASPAAEGTVQLGNADAVFGNGFE
ncbi:MAG: FG-GAP-like repeat-containing protein [Lysobacterales bacterium]